MLDSDLLDKLQGSSIEERIRVIEVILQTVKQDMQKITSPQPETAAQPQRSTFGFMQGTGIILGDVVAPVLPETDWEVLQ
jgi:hypothetical protein